MPSGDPEFRLSRRALLAGGAGIVVGACTGGTADDTGPTSSAADTTSTSEAPTTTTTQAPTTTAAAIPPFEGPDPFVLGVASGDPEPDSVVLWTRLLDATTGGPLTGEDRSVAFEVATDERFEDIVGSGLVSAPAAFGHSVHLVVDGLDADTWYWYRFRIGDHATPPARTRTTPVGPASPLRLGWSSCQLFESGSFAAHRHLAEADLDLFVWLGDYIYEDGPNDQGVTTASGPRVHASDEVVDLDGYRARYAQYTSDPWLQAHHAARPWIITWDDHEIDNNYAGATSEGGDAAFDARRTAAAQAWWEHMPLRIDPPTGPDIDIPRRVEWGDIATIHVLDGRQHRDPQPTDGRPTSISGFELQGLGPTALDPDHSMLGSAQEEWLVDGVTGSTARWNVLANQVYMHGVTALPGEPTINPDSWDGYHGNRARLLERLADATDDLVVLTGDFHAASVAALRPDPFDLTGPIVGTEFMAPAISSQFPEALLELAPIAIVFNPQVEFFDPRNGYMTALVDATTWTTTVHLLADVRDEESAIESSETYAVRAGAPGVFV